MIWMYTAAFLTGVLASMGVGGGMILIVYLTVFAGCQQAQAQGINLIYFIPIALLAVIFHTRSGLIEWKKLIPAFITGVPCAAAGAFAAYAADPELLSRMYGIFILLIGIKELFSGTNTNLQ